VLGVARSLAVHMTATFAMTTAGRTTGHQIAGWFTMSL
jgi:hypothetical protein